MMNKKFEINGQFICKTGCNFFRIKRDHHFYYERRIIPLYTSYVWNILRPRDKVKAIKDANPDEIRSFLGLINYVGKFIPNLATTTEPLRKLAKENAYFVCNKEQEAAFKKLKDDLSSNLVLSFFKLNRHLPSAATPNTHDLHHYTSGGSLWLVIIGIVIWSFIASEGGNEHRLMIHNWSYQQSTYLLRCPGSMFDRTKNNCPIKPNRQHKAGHVYRSSTPDLP